MEEKKTTVSFDEFQSAWLKCVAVIDELSTEKSYGELTMKAIGDKAGIPEELMIKYFLSIDILFQMYRITLPPA